MEVEISPCDHQYSDDMQHTLDGYGMFHKQQRNMQKGYDQVQVISLN